MTTPRPAGLFVTLAALYFAQALPVSMLGKALPALAREAGLATQWIGFLALPAIPWALKFIWAPWVDRWGYGHAGHRKRWIQACLLAVIALLAVVALFPREWLLGPGFAVLLLLLLLLNFFSATQDIATDGLATRMLTPALRGLGNSVQVNGYKLGMIAGSSALLIVVDSWGWRSTLAMVIAAMLLILVQVSRFREPAEQQRRSAREPVSVRWWWRQLIRFWQRPGVLCWLLILLFYKVGDSFGSRMINPYLVDQGWTLAAIGTLDLVASLVGLAGAGLAGVLMLRLRRRASLLLFAVLQALSFFLWAWQVQQGGNVTLPGIWSAALFEQFADGLSTVALFVVMMDYCRDSHEGSDYTMQASVRLFAAGLFTLASGFSATWLGYSVHFLLAGILSAAIIPVVMLWREPAGGAAGLRKRGESL